MRASSRGTWTWFELFADVELDEPLPCIEYLTRDWGRPSPDYQRKMELLRTVEERLRRSQRGVFSMGLP